MCIYTISNKFDRKFWYHDDIWKSKLSENRFTHQSFQSLYCSSIKLKSKKHQIKKYIYLITITTI